MMKRWRQNFLPLLVITACTFCNLRFAVFQQPFDSQRDLPALEIQPSFNKSIDTVQTSTSGILDTHNNDTDLLSCFELGTKCQFENIGKFLEGESPGIAHEPLPSIPSHRRIPHHMANNWTFIKEQANIAPTNESRTALVDYNPVILPLYKNGKNGIESDLHVDLLDRITGRSHPDFSDADADQVKYLAVSRITDIHNCGPGINPLKKNGPQNYLGLSLLDEELRLIKGTDIAINFGFWILGRHTNDFLDYYIYSARTTEGSQYKDGLFLMTSGQTHTFVFPFDIRRVPPTESESSRPDSASNHDHTWKSKVKGTIVPMNNNELSYGTGLEVRFMDDLTARNGKKFSTLLFREGPGLEIGKNFHFFESNNGTTYMEIWPRKPHRVRPINFYASKFKNYKKDINYIAGSIRESRGTTHLHEMIKSKREPGQSFQSQRVFHVIKIKAERGTACCVNMVLNGRRKVKVGILHGKVEPRNYLSKFYAFAPNPPFNVVAVTGWFCLGHMLEDDIGFASQWISQRDPFNRTAPSFINNYGNSTCPMVTFASGITEMVGHGGENIIISYGINDCYSRSLIVPKRKIEILLNGRR